MKKLLAILLSFYLGTFMYAQQTEEIDDNLLWEEENDSVSEHVLDELLIISNPVEKHLTENKALGSLDSYLEKSNSVNMIRRGAYAWEPMLQGMATERSVITIDGMRIYQACTDKMDPITSYVENTNLSEAEITGGSSGSAHGGTIAGGINLVRRKSGFRNKGLEGSVFAGFESVNKQQIYGTGLKFTQERFYTDVDFTFRDAENYKDGNGDEVLYSQFRKYNISGAVGYKISEKSSLEASVIYDKATDVGYPGLPMDVSLAEALIGSLQYTHNNLSEVLTAWDTKFYFNTITHVMDDSQRPDVPIRMDMPGWSDTYGMYSKLSGKYEKHQFSATLSAHHNNSLAEMVMYPNDPNESPMFMLTWPDVNTLYTGLHLEDKISFSHHFQWNLTAGLGFHRNEIQSEFGLNSLQIFYPEMKSEKSRLLKNLSTQLVYHHDKMTYKIGAGYGERAPSVSEAYGFYLFNAQDAYDYVGNPMLANEKALDLSLSAEFKNDQFLIRWKGNYFHILDYILGRTDGELLPMNIIADGVKVYEAIDYAHMINTDVEVEYRPVRYWTLSARASYRYGQGKDDIKLPLIQPFAYGFNVKYRKSRFSAEAGMEGNAKNSRYNPEFGETPKPAFAVVNAAVSKTFKIDKHNLTLKLGAENIFNEYYTTFSDWQNIPRPGRNFFGNIIFKF